MKKVLSGFLSLCLMSLLFVAAACAAPLPQAFIDALADAAVAERGEIVRDLVDINDYNQDLISRDIGGKTFILVASLVDGDYYDSYTEDELYAEAHPVLWVTVVPELKDFFAEKTAFPDDIYLRVIQLLGLRPKDVPGGKEYSRVVEFWVRPADLVRPCPDPEISDREAELDFPAIVKEFSPDFYLAMDWGSSTPVTVDWIEWFNGNRNYDPDVDWTCPWTRLGYTYDWGGGEDHVGLSEFIIETDAEIYVHSVQSLDRDYFTVSAGDGSSGGCSAFAPCALLLVFLPGGWCLVQALRKRTGA